MFVSFRLQFCIAQCLEYIEAIELAFESPYFINADPYVLQMPTLHRWIKARFWLYYFATWSLPTLSLCVSLASSVERTKYLSDWKKVLAEIFQLRQLEKRLDHPLEKCHLLLGTHFLVNEINKLPSNFAEIEMCFLSIAWSQESRATWINYRFWLHSNESLFWGFV